MLKQKAVRSLALLGLLCLPLSCALHDSISEPNVIHIDTINEFVHFSQAVNSGTSYNGSTVVLKADLDFSEAQLSNFTPIGISDTLSFIGEFDGQGHVISGLSVNLSFQHAGLFGRSNGMLVKNIVLDESCSIMSSHSSEWTYVGGIIGRCDSVNSSCAIENCVNMAKVSFVGDAKNNTYIAGIAGCLHMDGSFGATVKNCANYGSVTCSGKSDSIYIGGLVGELWGDPRKFIQNCLNYGPVIFSATDPPNGKFVGGIVGWAKSTDIDNCLSGGKTQINTDTQGAAVICYHENIQVTNCLWTGDADTKSTCNGGGIENPDSYKIDELNTITTEKMNTKAESSDGYTKWLTLHLNGGKITDIQYIDLVVMQTKLPVPQKEGSVFSFWCIDEGCNKIYNFSSSENQSVAQLYAAWNKIYVTFYCSECNLTMTRKAVTQGQKYGELPVPERTGHTFLGWFTDPEESGCQISESSKVTFTENHTLYSHWHKNKQSSSSSSAQSSSSSSNNKQNITNATRYVEISFGVKDLTKDEVKDIIESFTDDEFTIEKIGTKDGTDETVVIIRFSDVAAAVNFVEKIESLGESEKAAFRIIGFISEPSWSFTAAVHPRLFFLFILMSIQN